MWAIERANPTHVVYKTSSKPTEVDDLDVEILRAKMEKRDENSKGLLEDRVVEEIVLPPPIH